MPKPPRPTTPRRPGPARKPAADAAAPRIGERIAKVLARAGVASRREAEAIIAAGRVAVNGKAIDSPALNVGPRDRITLDGQPLAAPEPARLWLYHKPLGLVTTERDEKGRPTVFAALPEGMPRVMSVGRLDINSEGLLLLTNDGELKRRLELPATGWLRRYRVRVKGSPADATLEPLRQGITIEGERFQPMSVTLDRQQGANAWLTVGIREGRNREVRRAMEAVGLVVNRLIRVGYGPFQLGDLAAGAVEEVRAKVLRDQLGLAAPEPEAPRSRTGAGDAAAGARRAPRPTDASRATGPGTARPGTARAGGPATGATTAATAEPRGKGASGKSPREGTGGKPGAAARARAAIDEELTAGKPARRSWASRSHGVPARTGQAGTGQAGKGSARTGSAGAEDAPGGARGKPRSWASKRATPTAVPPRRPGTGPKTPR